MRPRKLQLLIGVTSASLVFVGPIALYVFDSGIHPDNATQRFVRVFTVFQDALFLLVLISIVVGWRASCDVSRFQQGLLRTLWKPILEPSVFGFLFGFLWIAAAGITGSGHDMFRPATIRQWAALLFVGLQMGGALAALGAAGGFVLAVLNRGVWCSVRRDLTYRGTARLTNA